MPRSWVRVVAALAAGAAVGAVGLLAAFASHPGFVLEMDRSQPPFLSGVYAVERAGDLTFAWTAERATLRLPGLDRRRDWTCVARLRGARPPDLPPPDVAVLVDGTPVVHRAAGTEFDDLRVSIPRAGRRGASVALVVAPAYQPGHGDPRVLGVQLDRLACAPDDGWAWPPAQTWRAALSGPAAIAGAVVLAGGSMLGALAAAAAAGTGAAALLSTDGAAFGSFPATLAWVLLAAAGMILLGSVGARLRVGSHPRATLAALVLASVGGALKLLALLHPAKLLVDALFQAHRLEWVMSGRYFFTQPMPEGVAFPYAIALYVAAAPFAGLVSDHVALLRGVVCVAEAASAGVVALAIVRAWGDRLAGALAIAFLFLAPLPFVVVGNGNLTNAFGQFAAAIVLGLIASGVAAASPAGGAALLTAVTAVALLSHVSTMAVLAPTLGAVVIAFWLFGQQRLRRDAAVVAVAGAAAMLLAVFLYYGHFADVYREALERVHAPAAAANVEAGEATGSDERLAALTRQLTWTERARDAMRQSADAVGWPMLLLAVAGVVRTSREGWRDRLTLVLTACAAVWGSLVIVGTVLHVGTQYQRYASEFMGRIDLATYPVIAILAGRGAAWPWANPDRRAFVLFRLGSVLLTAAAFVLGARAWLGWLQ